MQKKILGGYMGKILWVNLSTGEIKEEIPEEKLYLDFVGGYGLGARIIFTRQKAGVDPLGPDSILGFVTGPLTGSPALGGTKYTVVFKSPLTGGWGDSNSGGHFGPYLKFAGYDAIFFTGISEKPVYLAIEDGKGELRDASHLWGKDTYETIDILKGKLGERIKVACIGPAGEKASPISGIITDKSRAAARAGGGAVMGSKKLKAIAAFGTKEVPVANKNEADELRRSYLGKLKGNQIADIYGNFGTPLFIDLCSANGEMPSKNWGGITTKDFANFEPLTGKKVLDLEMKKEACWHCPLACGGLMKKGTEYDYEAGAIKPEYETLVAFGALCLNNNLESIVKATDICNRYGVDTIAAGSAIALAIECYENGIITSKDTDGVELKWGNHQAIITMLEKLAKREGFGAVLADGVKLAAERIGKEAEQYAIHIGGAEIPLHDPKFGPGLALTYQLDATPSHHMQGGTHYAELGWGFATAGLGLSEFDKYDYKGKGEVQKRLSTITHAVSASGLCLFVDVCFGPPMLVEFMSAVTGQPYTIDDFLKIGERISNLRHAFNLREGINPLQFKVPDRVLGKPAQTDGPLAGVTIDQESQIRGYLKAMDWNPVTCKPSKAKLEELGLGDIASSLL
jgi:aldehyde:ferredoxin oxidoreductase